MKNLYAIFKQILVAFFVLITLPGWSQNLLTNPGAEDGQPASNGWTAVISGTQCTVGGGWRIPSGSSGYPVANNGAWFFNPGCGGAAGTAYELRQDVSVSAYTTAIDAGAYRVSFSGYTQSFNQSPADEATITVEYRNAANNAVLSSYTTGATTNTGGAWVRYSNTQLAPVGTRFVRVRLLGTWRSGDAIDAYFDDLSISGVSVLPVNLLAFSAEAKSGRVALQWQTAEEKNLKGFHVLRSADGVNWADMGFVPANAGPSAVNEYRFIDEAPLMGTGLYRLQQTDLNGASTLSRVVTANFGKASDVILYPNPAKDKLFFKTVQPVLSIEITDHSGRVLEKHAGLNPVSIGHLLPGTYIVRINGRNFTEYKQVVKE